jgi:hypothetical protein
VINGARARRSEAVLRGARESVVGAGQVDGASLPKVTSTVWVSPSRT